MRTTTHIAVALLAGTAASTLSAGPLLEARVNKVINDVSVVAGSSGESRPARLNDVVSAEMGVKTGVKSRSELLFQDNTLTRIGPESYFSFKAGTRDMSLGEGTVLLQVPKGLGGAKIRTGAVTAAITGTTIMMEYRPKQSIKVLVLEGSMRLSVNGRFGDSLLLLPGNMVIMPPDAKRIPDPVSVDLKKVVKTSALVNMASKNGKTVALPSMPLIEQEITGQQQARSRGTLVDTNLSIFGEGTNVVLASDDVTSAANRNANVVATLAANIAPTPAPTPAPKPDSAPTIVPLPAPVEAATPGATATPAANPTPTPALPTEPNPTTTPSVAPSATPQPTPQSSPQPSPTPPIADNDEDDPDENYDEVVEAGDENKAIDVTVDSPIDLSPGGRSGKVKIRSSGSIVIKSTVKVSDSAADHRSTRGGSIDVRSQKKNGVAISVRSSAQLLSLLDAAAPGPGGKIRFRSTGGAVNITGARLQADRGLISIRNSGDQGIVALENATLSANTIKVHALGKNGQLNIGGGTISADALIDLYAGGSNGQVNFTDNVTLSGTSVKTIAGHSVTIANEKTVIVSGSGPAQVFTNNPNYTGSGGNGSTTGTFSGAGATTQPFSARPGGD